MPRSLKKKPAKQLDREIAESLAKRNGDSMERITHTRVIEPLAGEQLVSRQPIQITLVDAVGPEPWDLIVTAGKRPPYGVGKGGRILIVLPGSGPQDPLAGLAYSIEHGRPYVHHVWVDADVRRRGLSQVLFDAYRAQISPELVVVGPFTKGGRRAAERAGATIEELASLARS